MSGALRGQKSIIRPVIFLPPDLQSILRLPIGMRGATSRSHTHTIMPAKKAARKATAKKASAKKTTTKTAAKKTPAKKVAATKQAKPVKKAATKAAGKPSTEAVARQAYLNYLHRVSNGLPGDSEQDWVEAERALKQG